MRKEGKRKALAALVCGSMLTVALVGGTLAYLQDDDSDVNVMTLGNVSIEQQEYERVVDESGAWVSTGETDKYGYTPDKLQEFKNHKPLYPAVFADGSIKWDDRNGSSAEDGTGHQQSWGQVVSEAGNPASGSNQLFDDSVKGVIDKFVFVENTGKSDAYVRTLIALEQGGIEAENFKNVIMMNSDKDHWDWERVATDIVIANEKGVPSEYYVVAATYKGPSSNPTGILAPGFVSYPSLLQVYMKPDATNEDVEAIDGNDSGTYEIIVLSQAAQTNGFADAETALNTAFGEANEENVAKWFGAIVPDTWDGTVDTSWYNDTDTEFTIVTAEQLAGLAELVDNGNAFVGKTVKLGKDLDLYAEDENGEPVSFEPIGSFSDDKAFEGTFDGQNHTISNLYQSGWALANGYWDGSEYGMGLFSLVENATIKNLNFDGADLPTEANIIGVVAGGAANCVFENINITGAYLGNHSWYSGGAIGWAEGDVKLINCDIDATSVVSSQWGDFNNANGGLIGGIDGASIIYLKDCDVACVIDAYNDVTSAYEWYSYRSCGMLIGDTGQKDDPDGNNVGDAIAPNLTCENVTVTYGTWANYHYCEFVSASYPFCRVEAGESTGAYGNARVGEYTDANGNKVVDDNHAHNAGEKHNELIVFDQLYGGATGDRYCTYGTATHNGVTVIYNNK